jgi:hypothetical protein
MVGPATRYSLYAAVSLGFPGPILPLTSLSASQLVEPLMLQNASATYSSPGVCVNISRIKRELKHGGDDDDYDADNKYL